MAGSSGSQLAEDEPDRVALIVEYSAVVAVHGYSGEGQEVMLGGPDERLKLRIGLQMRRARIDVKLDPLQVAGVETDFES